MTQATSGLSDVVERVDEMLEYLDAVDQSVIVVGGRRLFRGDIRALRAALEASRLSVLEAEKEWLTKALDFYANPEIYRPHPHGPAFDDCDLSFVARAALAKARGDA